MTDDPGQPTPASAWNDGVITLRIEKVGREAARVVKVRRPFAVIGRAGGSWVDVGIDDRLVEESHTYLHLDHRGLFAVDLLSRHGTFLDGRDTAAGWLGPGGRIEVAGRTIDVLDLWVDGARIDPPPCADDPLSEPGGASFPVPTIRTLIDPRRTWTLDSELNFLGGDEACGIRVEGGAVAPVHCALVRTNSNVFVVDLTGLGTRINGRPVGRIARVPDGSQLSIGTTSFRVQVQPGRPRSGPPARRVNAPAMPSETLIAQVVEPERDERPAGGNGHELIPADAQRMLLSWMMETIRDAQESSLRQQGEMQHSMLQLMRQIQQDNSQRLEAHLNRLETIDRELAEIRLVLAKRNDQSPSPPLPSQAPPPPPPEPLQVSPLRITRQANGASKSRDSAAWLIGRVSQLQEESRSAWKDLLGNVTPSGRREP